MSETKMGQLVEAQHVLSTFYTIKAIQHTISPFMHIYPEIPWNMYL